MALKPKSDLGKKARLITVGAIEIGPMKNNIHSGWPRSIPSHDRVDPELDSHFGHVADLMQSRTLIPERGRSVKSVFSQLKFCDLTTHRTTSAVWL